MGTQRLGLGPDEGFDSEENLDRASLQDGKEPDEAIRKLTNRLVAWRHSWILVALGCASFLFLCDWAGYREKPAPWGDPKSLSEIWWHFPLILAAALIVVGALVFGRDR